MRKLLITFLFFLGAVIMINSKTILFIGDSITDGNWGSPGKYPCSSDERNKTDLNHVLGHGYAEMISGFMGGEFPDSGYNFINRGISGETLEQIAARWEKDAMAYDPVLISLLCGTNNIHFWLESKPEDISEFDIGQYMDQLDSLVVLTRNRLPETTIVLCTPFVAKAGWSGRAGDFDLRKQGVDTIASLTRKYVQDLGDPDLKLVDFNALLEELYKENPSAEYWVWDGIHPTTPMHYRMAKEWIKIVGLQE